MHIDKTYRRAYNIEPNMCWECYSCVKACPQNAIDVRGYADFAPLGHSVRVDRDERKGTIAWKIKFRDGTEKNFLSPITTKPWGTAIPKLADSQKPSCATQSTAVLGSIGSADARGVIVATVAYAGPPLATEERGVDAV